jgi:hypothetical protein
VPDKVILSFLRHYSARREGAMEDPAALRHELTRLLDTARPAADRKREAALAALAFAIFLGWQAPGLKASSAQQAELKEMVQQVVAAEKDRGASYPAVWSSVKKPLDLRRYNDMTWLDYRAARAMLQKRLGRES